MSAKAAAPAKSHAKSPAGANLGADRAEEELLQSIARDYPQLANALAGYDYFTVELANQFAGVLQRIEDAWDTEALLPLLDDLIVSERAGRKGFPPSVILELVFLKEVALLGAEAESETLGLDVYGISRGKELQPPSGFRLSHLRQSRKAEVVEAAPNSDLRHVWPEITSVDGLLEALDLAHGQGQKTHRKLGEILVACRVITDSQLAAGLSAQSNSEKHLPLGSILTKFGHVNESAIIRGLCVQAQIPLVDPMEIVPGPDLLKLVPLNDARDKGAFPVALTNRGICLAVPNPFSFEATNYFKFVTGKQVILVQAERERIDQALGQVVRKSDKSQPALASWLNAASTPEGEAGKAVHSEEDGGVEEIVLSDDVVDQNDSSVIGLVNRILGDAIKEGASDIHVEVFPRAKAGQIRFRRDGLMTQYSEVPLVYYPAVISRIKILASMDISERRKPQDGRLAYTVGRKRYEFRVASLPTSAGLEAAVLRLLANSGAMSIENAGLPAPVLASFKSILSKPHGLILVCGPTGSGKTTTLHAALKYLNTPHRKILTAEDPVEITQANITQVPINHKIGLDFSSVLRSFLRADPDVIMIGEMRDLETAKIAVESSMTGHLVLSTLHTNSAAETVARVLEMGIDQFNFSDALSGVMAQRLARRVCQTCAESYFAGNEELEALAEEFHSAATNQAISRNDRDALVRRWISEFARDGRLVLKRAKGCEACKGSGYKGRLGLYEFMNTDVGNIRQLIRAHAPSDEIQAVALKGGMRLLKQDGIEKVLQGLTTLSEVHGVCG